MCILDFLKRYHQINKTLPKKIIVFRDGVGDGMLEAVRDHEVSQLNRAAQDVGNGYKYITFLCIPI